MVEPLRSGRRASEGVRRGEGAEEPRIEEMELWAQRACLRMAEVTVMHSVTTSATGSIATGTGPERRGRRTSMSAMVVWWYGIVGEAGVVCVCMDTGNRGQQLTSTACCNREMSNY
jgi:hypothetical protein